MSLEKRFSNTHDLQIIDSKPRTVQDFELDMWIPAAVKNKIMDEKRPGIMQWLVGIPKKTSNL